VPGIKSVPVNVQTKRLFWFEQWSAERQTIRARMTVSSLTMSRYLRDSPG
jgi:hypothetical protein